MAIMNNNNGNLTEVLHVNSAQDQASHHEEYSTAATIVGVSQ